MRVVQKDKGWAWAVPIGGFIVHFIFGGFGKSFGIIMLSTQELFDTGAAPLALAGGLMYTFMYCLSFIGILLSERFGCKTAINIGSAICVLSFICAYISISITMWIISVGLGIGLSVALIWAPIFSQLGRCFSKRIGLAMGISVAGSSIGQMTIPYFISYLIDTYGIRCTFLVGAGLVSHLFIAAALMPRHITDELTDPNSNKIGDNYQTKEQSNMRKKCISLTKIHIAMLVIYILSKIFGDIGDTGLSFTLPLFGESMLAFSKQHISSAIAVAGVLDFIARVLVGVIIDKTRCRGSLLLKCAWLIEALNSFCFVYFTNTGTYFLFYGIFGLCSGASVTLITIVLIELVDQANFSIGLAVMMFVVGLFIGAGQFLVGYIADKTGDYLWSLKFLGLSLLMALLILALEYPMKKICFHTTKASDVNDDKFTHTSELGNKETEHIHSMKSG